jgi:ribose transport system ATP-binding protein
VAEVNRKKLIDMRNITKYIYNDQGKGNVSSGIKILDGVDFDLYPGEIHVLMGENGAGKSTLMNVLGGVIEPDDGEIYVDGQAVRIPNTKTALEIGIGFIHQELNLCSNIDITHNIFMAREIKNKIGLTKVKEMNQQSRKMLGDLGFHINPKTKLSNLSTAVQQIVEIAKVLSYNSRLIIMDEPTATLTSHEIEILFKLIGELRGKGIGIIYISHRMEEIEDIGDRFTVLRDGKLVGTLDKEHYSRSECIRMMVGREVNTMYVSSHTPTDEVILSVQGLCIGKNTKPIDFDVKKGEVVSFGGLVGAGRTELAKSIFGAREYFGGTITFEGCEYKNPTPRKSIDLGISYLTEDRKAEGLILQEGIDQNIAIASLYRLFPKRFINKKRETELALDIIEQFNIVCTNPMHKVGTLSGGNQQKVSLGKWYATNPKILILDEPTRGIDVNAKTQIYKAIDDCAKNGMAIIIITSDMHELIGISDRIYIMHEGNLVAEVSKKEDMVQEKLLTYFLETDTGQKEPAEANH